LQISQIAATIVKGALFGWRRPAYTVDHLNVGRPTMMNGAAAQSRESGLTPRLRYRAD
jgi:hypothetical protein